MYYRLLAPHLLPENLNRILYLDPDILVINSLRPLWDLDLKGHLFAAASHTGITEFANSVNRLRLRTNSNYYNSGVLLMDLSRCRKEIVPKDIFAYAEKHKADLFLPDQDISMPCIGSGFYRWMMLSGTIPPATINSYLLRSSGKTDMDWVIANTSVLHFCGRTKPWAPRYPYRFRHSV